jgi:hypothetical protein
MIKEEVVWAFKTREDALALASNILCRGGHEVFVKHIAIDLEVVAYLVVERKVEE